MPMANQAFTPFVTVRLPSTAVRASNERPSIHRVGRMAEEHRRRSGVNRTETEREPARTVHLAWFAGPPGAADAKCLRPPNRFVKWNEGPRSRCVYTQPRVVLAN